MSKEHDKCVARLIKSKLSSLTTRRLRLMCCALSRMTNNHSDYLDWSKAILTSECVADSRMTPFGKPSMHALDQARKSIKSTYGWLHNSFMSDGQIVSHITDTLFLEVGNQGYWHGPYRLYEDILNWFGPYSMINPNWITSDVKSVAWRAYMSAYSPHYYMDDAVLGVLSDGLEEAGCDDHYILSRLRRPDMIFKGDALIDKLIGVTE